MIALACDHGGYALMQDVKKYLDETGVEYKDLGTHSAESCDYPVYGEAAARAVVSGQCARGIIICGTGIGISIAANKVNGARAALCSDCFSAEMARRHNNANLLALGGRVLGTGLALKIVETYLNSGYDGGRHERRVRMIGALENR